MLILVSTTISYSWSNIHGEDPSFTNIAKQHKQHAHAHLWSNIHEDPGLLMNINSREKFAGGHKTNY